MVRPLLLLLAGCAAGPVVEPAGQEVEGGFPADFTGSWQRNYARDDDVNLELRRSFYDLSRIAPDPVYAREPGLPLPSQKDAESLIALARLAEAITRSDVLTIAQDQHEIRVSRKDDFALTCVFHGGRAREIGGVAGTEICGWDGDDLVSHLKLADGLQVVHRFTVSDDGEELRVITTVASPTARLPFSLERYFRKFEQAESEFHCIETLSMKRVCSTREIEP